MFGESSASEGEIVEPQHKANTASNHHGEPGIDRSSRGFGRNGLSEMNGYKTRDRTRSPSPYRRKPGRSPSPYRRGRSRSPSPYRRDKDKANRGRGDKPPQSHKRKASPIRHPRPEKRSSPAWNGDHGRRDAAPHGHTRGAGAPSHPDNGFNAKQNARLAYAGNGHYTPPPPIPSFIDKKPDTNGHRPSNNAQPSRPNAPGPGEPLDIDRKGKDAASVSTSAAQKTEPEYIPLPTVEEPVITEETREEKRRRWAAKRAQLAAESSNQGPNLLQHALTNAAEAGTPQGESPARTNEKSVSPALDSPRFPYDMDSVPPSPDVMVIDKEDGIGEASSPPANGPSAANYDPTQDMLDDRARAEQKAQQTGVSASAYDETDPKQLSTLPAEKSRPAKKKKKELDMFAFSDEEDEGDEEVEEDDDEPDLAKGTVLDAKLLDNWDDADGYYKIISNELVNAERYRMIRGLGRGVFANVAEAEDVKSGSGQLVAIKMVRKNEAMRKASQKEMDFLQRLNDADPQDKRHIIRFFGSFDHKGHLCIVFEHMLKNLRDLLKEDTSGHGLSLQAVKTYSRQMFSGLKHLQDCQIVHADLKPDNILVSHDRKTVKLCDLGTAADKRDNSEPTPYLVSRFYRAPEIILGMDIGYPIDMWAIGCTIYELWTGKILFPGRSNNQMVKVIMECMGWPTERLLKKGSLSGDHFEAGPPLKFISREMDPYTNQPKTRIIEQQRMTNCPLKSRVQEAGRDIAGNGPSQAELNDLVDLLGACLNWNFEKRIQPKEALNHKLFVKPTLAPRSAVVKPTVPKRGYLPRK